MAKRKFTKLEQIGIIVMVGVVGMFFYLKRVYDPTVKKYSSLAGEVKELKEKEVAARGGKDIERRLKDKEKDLKKSEQDLVKTEAQAREIMTKVMEIAESNRLTITGYSIPGSDILKDTVKSFLYKRRYYDIRLSGDYGNLILALGKINRLPHLVTIENVDISRSKVTEDTLLDISLLLSI